MISLKEMLCERHLPLLSVEMQTLLFFPPFNTLIINFSWMLTFFMCGIEWRLKYKSRSYLVCNPSFFHSNVAKHQSSIFILFCPGTSVMPADQKLQSHTYSRLVEKFKKCDSEQGRQKFWSSRLIINSRWLWNLHQRHKFLRAEAFRDVLKFIESQKWHFQEFLRGIFHCWCHVVLSEYTHHSGNIAVEMSQAFHDVTQFRESNLFKYALNVIQNWETDALQ